MKIKIKIKFLNIVMVGITTKKAKKRYLPCKILKKGKRKTQVLETAVKTMKTKQKNSNLNMNIDIHES